MTGQTLSQAYFSDNDVHDDRLLVAYNDEPPNQKSNSRKGHLKGVVVADKRSGFWLVHSVPLYPNITCEYFVVIYLAFLFNSDVFYVFLANPEDYHYPPTGLIYGQSFLCLSLSADQIDIVGKQLIYNEPQIYESKLPQSLISLYPNIGQLIEGKRIDVGPFWNDADLTTIGGEPFKAFAKSSKFAKELYEDWVNF